jgi:hypothetical protein
MPADKPLGLEFQVNGQVVASSPDLRQSIPADGMALVCGSKIVAENSRWSDHEVTFSVQAQMNKSV